MASGGQSPPAPDAIELRLRLLDQARVDQRPEAVGHHLLDDLLELIALVGSRLASYKRPSRVVVVDEIPRLPSGKVLRRVLRETYGRPADS